LKTRKMKVDTGGISISAEELYATGILVSGLRTL